MRAVDLIEKKRDGYALTEDEMQFLIKGYTSSEIPDYQMAAWAMAVFFQGLDQRETMALTRAMIASGETVNLAMIKGVVVDKHSTGGVGDTTTIVLAPLVAAAGVPVAKMSGRGLGHTGGTLDKLGAIPGFKLALPVPVFAQQVNQIGIGIIGQTGNLVPADKKLYALRDVTGTVESLPLIAASIMSKKIAAGAHRIVLDVKTGSGAFMKTEADALALAQLMVNIGTDLDHPTVALVTDMNQPLGNAIGNGLEIQEAIATLQGEGPADLTELCLSLGSELLVLAERVSHPAEGRALLQELLVTGRALDKFAQLIRAQGGNADILDAPELLPRAPEILPVMAEETGYVAAIDSLGIGHCAMLLGAGRATKDDTIDLAVGIDLRRKRGDFVKKGEVLAYLHAASASKGRSLIPAVSRSYKMAPAKPEQIPLIRGRLTGHVGKE